MFRKIAVVVLGLTALVGATANAERSQSGSLIVALNGGIAPRKLPRHRRAPVAVRLAGRVLTQDNLPVPRVNWIRLELAWRGVLDTRGLGTCPRARLDGTTTRLALAHCQDAEVGQGRLYARVFLPGEPGLGVRARLTAFNGRTKEGRHAVLVHAYSSDPPVSFVIPFSVHHRSGNFHTVLVALIRRSVGPFPHVANFEIKVGRHFLYRGHEHSYISAACPVPKGFTAAFLSFARATYTFEGGKQLTTDSVRSCRARPEPLRPRRVDGRH
jgi:hypothetical protein